jgi:hypothetical protein
LQSAQFYFILHLDIHIPLNIPLFNMVSSSSYNLAYYSQLGSDVNDALGWTAYDPSVATVMPVTPLDVYHIQ